MTRHRLHQKKPISLLIMENNVGHLAMATDFNVQLGQPFPIEVAPFRSSIAGVDQDAAGRKARRKLFDDCFNQFAVFTRTEAMVSPVINFTASFCIARSCAYRAESVGRF